MFVGLFNRVSEYNPDPYEYMTVEKLQKLPKDGISIAEYCRVCSWVS